MTKQEAVSMVASHVAGNLLSGSLEEATGIHWADLDRLSEADRERLTAAVDIIAGRLYRMGRQRPDA